MAERQIINGADGLHSGEGTDRGEQALKESCDLRSRSRLRTINSQLFLIDGQLQRERGRRKALLFALYLQVAANQKPCPGKQHHRQRDLGNNQGIPRPRRNTCYTSPSVPQQSADVDRGARHGRKDSERQADARRN